MMKKINQVSESMNWRINLKRSNLEKNKIQLRAFHFSDGNKILKLPYFLNIVL
jgi:hypothetical protein